MDYIKEFGAVKSVFEYIDKHVKPLSKIYFRSGNEAVLNEILSRLRKVLTDCALLDAETEAPLEKAYPLLRKIMMFILVNVDINYKYDLQEDEHVGHLVGLLPLLPKCILFDIAWELKLDQFLFEALSYTPCWFSFGFFDAISLSLKFIEDQFLILDKVEQLLRALNTCLARSEMGQESMVEKVNIYKRLYDYSINTLRQFYTPDGQNLKKKEKIRHLAVAIKHLLQIAIHAIEVYENPTAAEPQIDISIYKLGKDLQENPLKKPIKSVELKEQQLQIIKVVLNSLHYKLEPININTFLDWNELEDTNNINMQLSIGQLTYDLVERLKRHDEITTADFIHKLEQIAVSPEAMMERLQAVGIGKILAGLETEQQIERKEQWFNELMNRAEVLFNEECQDIVKKNIGFMKLTHCKSLVDFIARYDAMAASEKDAGIDESELEDIAGLVLLALNNLETDEIADLLCHQANSLKVRTEIFCQSDDFHERVTKLFNQHKNNTTFDLRHFLILSFENPKEVWERFFEVSSHIETQIQNFCTIMRATPAFSNEFIFVLLQDAIEDEYKTRLKYFPNLLCEIYFTLPTEQRLPNFIQKFMHKNINTFLEAQNFHLIGPLVKTLSIISQYDSTNTHKPLHFGDMTAPVLMMVARIMDKARWSLLSYSNERELLVKDCIAFIRDTTKIFLPVATEKARMWLSKSFKDAYLPTTRYYFQKYALKKDQAGKSFADFINTTKLDLKQSSNANQFLLKYLVHCTMKETEWLAAEPDLLPHMPRALANLCEIATAANDMNAFECYLQCLANYTNVVRLFILPHIVEKASEFEGLMYDIFEVIIKSEPTELFEQTFGTFEYLVLELFEKWGQQVPEVIVTKIRKFLDATNENRCTHLFKDKFEELVSKH